MTRILSGLSLFFLYCSARAQPAAANVPEEPTNTTGVIIFLVLFVGFCVGFIWMVYAADKKKKEKERNATSRDASGKTT